MGTSIENGHERTPADQTVMNLTNRTLLILCGCVAGLNLSICIILDLLPMAALLHVLGMPRRKSLRN